MELVEAVHGRVEIDTHVPVPLIATGRNRAEPYFQAVVEEGTALHSPPSPKIGGVNGGGLPKMQEGTGPKAEGRNPVSHEREKGLSTTSPLAGGQSCYAFSPICRDKCKLEGENQVFPV